jgi:glycosyltransferase involved in cell wall biosynthesis
VQWVPHGFGLGSLNLPFCHWLRRRSALAGDRVELMVHEPFLEFGPGLLRNAAAAGHRLMMATLLRAASRLFVAIPAWGPMLAPYAFGRRLEVEWLPLPSTVPVIDDPAGRAEVRRALGAEDRLLIGHFGTYGPGVREALVALLSEVRQRLPDASILLLGKGGRRFVAGLRSRGLDAGDGMALEATGPLPEEALSLHLGACDLLAQPYPDGVSGRRTSALAGLAHGIALATTSGPLTEPLWGESGAVAMAPVGDPAALAERVLALALDREGRQRAAAAGIRLYDRYFALRHTLERLRRTPAPAR